MATLATPEAEQETCRTCAALRAEIASLTRRLEQVRNEREFEESRADRLARELDRLKAAARD